jgi:hypothetical protein
MTLNQNVKALMVIPSVGPSIAKDLHRLGINSVTDLRGKNPEEMYLQLCTATGQKVDRCVLYVFRCAVYFAENDRYDPELLKWWNWTDQKKSLHHPE